MTDTTIGQLKECAARRRETEEQMRRERHALAKLLAQGQREGIPILHMARAAGVSRQTVYHLMDGKRTQRKGQS